MRCSEGYLLEKPTPTELLWTSDQSELEVLEGTDLLQDGDAPCSASVPLHRDGWWSVLYFSSGSPSDSRVRCRRMEASHWLDGIGIMAVGTW